MNKPDPTPAPAPVLQRCSPDDLMVGFARSRFVLALVLSVLLVTVVVAGTSPRTIMDWMDPDGAEARKLVEEEARKKAQEEVAQAEAARRAAERAAAPKPTQGQPATPGTKPTDGTTPPGTATPANTTTPPQGSTPVENRVNEVAKPEEVPENPFKDLGL